LWCRKGPQWKDLANPWTLVGDKALEMIIVIREAVKEGNLPEGFKL